MLPVVAPDCTTLAPPLFGVEDRPRIRSADLPELQGHSPYSIWSTLYPEQMFDSCPSFDSQPEIETDPSTQREAQYCRCPPEIWR